MKYSTFNARGCDDEWTFLHRSDETNLAGPRGRYFSPRRKNFLPSLTPAVDYKAQLTLSTVFIGSASDRFKLQSVCVCVFLEGNIAIRRYAFSDG